MRKKNCETQKPEKSLGISPKPSGSVGCESPSVVFVFSLWFLPSKSSVFRFLAIVWDLSQFFFETLNFLCYFCQLSVRLLQQSGHYSI
jgi:hypothetical protein